MIVSNSGTIEGVVAIIFYLIYMVVYFGMLAFIIASIWKLFTKAGEAGWKSLIPVYNTYIMYKISGKKNLFWIQLGLGIAIIILSIVFIVSMIFSLAMLFGGSGLESSYVVFWVSLVLLLVASIASFVVQCFFSVGLAKSFGQETLFAVGLIFLSPIFIAILAFSKNIQYVGPGGFGGYIDNPPYAPLNTEKNPYNYNNTNNWNNPNP